MPLYDTSGNLVALTRGTDGTPVEKYAYSPFGEQRIFVDLTRPRIEQLRREGDALLLEVSEKIQLAALVQAQANGDLTLTDTSTGQPIEVEVSLPVLTGRTARKRIRIQPTTTIAESTPVRLHLAPKAVLDFFQNPLEAAYDRDLVWSATGSALIEDTAAPQLDLVRVHENVLTVGFTETIDVAQATTAITVDGNPVTWTAEEDGYGLRTDPPVANGQHRIEIAATLTDLAGTPLGTGFARTIEITPAGVLVYVRPDPREISSTAASNPYGFQGLPRDPETGFVYARNRYYDPEIGRFISTDPLGYVDGGNLYQYGLNDPVNNADQLGLQVAEGVQSRRDCEQSGQSLATCTQHQHEALGGFAKGVAKAPVVAVTETAKALWNWRDTIQGGTDLWVNKDRIPELVQQGVAVFLESTPSEQGEILGNVVGGILTGGAAAKLWSKARTLLGAAEKLEDVAEAATKPKWLRDLEAGQAFNRAHAFDYPYRELYIEKPGGGGYFRLDAYDPIRGEIVSRKLTSFADVTEETGISYINELAKKYPAGAVIADVRSSGPLSGQRLRGQLVLEVPPQSQPIPAAVLNVAKQQGVLIRDVNGAVY